MRSFAKDKSFTHRYIRLFGTRLANIIRLVATVLINWADIEMRDAVAQHAGITEGIPTVGAYLSTVDIFFLLQIFVAVDFTACVALLQHVEPGGAARQHVMHAGSRGRTHEPYNERHNGDEDNDPNDHVECSKTITAHHRAITIARSALGGRRNAKTPQSGGKNGRNAETNDCTSRFHRKHPVVMFVSAAASCIDRPKCYSNLSMEVGFGDKVCQHGQRSNLVTRKSRRDCACDRHIADETLLAWGSEMQMSAFGGKADNAISGHHVG